MFGADVQKILTSADSASIAVANQATVYTKSLRLKRGVYFGLQYKAVSASGAPDIDIEFEQSYTLPATEGSSDANWVVPEGMSNIETNLTTETYKIKNLSPVPMPYGRLKITGNAGNVADTVVTAFLAKIED